MVAGRPLSSLAAHSAVAALPLPPPMPAPWGTRFCRAALNLVLTPVCFLNSSNALITRLDASVGTPSMSQVSTSWGAPAPRASTSRVSPRSMTWNREARSW